MNLTIPVSQLTGDEIPANQLAQPDERYAYYLGLTAENLQSGFLQAEKQLGPKVPDIIRDRMAVSRKLGAFAWFCWEFNTVSMFWSLSNIELALRVRYNETRPADEIVVSKGWDRKVIAARETLDYYGKGWEFYGKADSKLKFAELIRWAFDNSLLPRQISIKLELLQTIYNNKFAYSVLPRLAIDQGWVPANASLDDIFQAWDQLPPEEKEKHFGDGGTVLIQELPRLRNLLAHPSEKNRMTVGPSGAIESYELLVEIVSRLWPREIEN